MLLYQSFVLFTLITLLVLVWINLRDYAPVASPTPPRPEERLFILIPARNEAHHLRSCLDGLLAQNWRCFTVLVLDDASEDGTGEIVAEYACKDPRVQLLQGRPIEPGWAGKVWACAQLGEAALSQGADWLLFLDADTRAHPDFVGTILAYGQTTGAGMVSGFPYQIAHSFWERAAMPMLHFLITTFLPIRLVWLTPFPQLVAACGQVELFHAETYRKIGGHASIPLSFHDGLQLARRVKAAGHTVRLLDVSPLIACRMYDGGRAVWNGFTRNAYEGLGSFGALVVMTTLQVVLFLLPFVFLLAALAQRPVHGSWPSWSALCLAQVGVILWIRLLQARRFGHLDAVWMHPLSIALMVAIQWASWWRTLRRQSIVWKGRIYALCLLVFGAQSC
ncbi:MAG: glycosyltransferase [Chloroherpetonaceae bacterium]|nr:glycosyltransferase [Chthonomonadaceae bacterium]MDW8208997.1 glycosyltransferase [Chloroherpetonaceae bacterium]